MAEGHDMPEQAGRMEAVLALLLQSSEEELPRAREAVRAILADEGGGEAPATDAAPAQHARRGGMLAYARRPAPEGGAALARFYAALYSALAAAGRPPSDDESDSACDELAPCGWAVEPDGHAWRPVRLEEGTPRHGAQQYRKGVPLLYASVRAPRGGVNVNGTFYPGGRFIPSRELEAAGMVRLPSGEQQDGKGFLARRQAAALLGRGRRRAARPEGASLAPLAALARSFPSPGYQPDRGRIARAFAALRAANGGRTPARLAEIALLVRAALAGPESRSVPMAAKASLARSLAELALMARLASPPDAALANTVRIALPQDGTLWALPGVPEAAVEEFEAVGFAQAAPGRWAAPDTPEARELALRHGYKLVVPREGGEEAAA